MQLIFGGVMLLLTFLGSLFTSFISIFFQHASKRLLIIAAVLGVMAGFVSGFYILIDQIIGGIAAAVPTGFAAACSLVVPDNLATIVSVQITARLARFAYEWNVKVLQWRL